MLIKQFVFVFLLVYAIGRVFETFRKRAQLPGEILVPYSLQLIVATYVLFYLTVLWKCFESEGQDFHNANVIVAIAAVLISTFGRNWAIKRLGIYHSIHIEIRGQHKLIKSGPYRYVRNPYYLSNVIEALGLASIVNFPIAVLISAAIYLSLLCCRLILEEKALQSKFNKAFDDYKMSVPRIIPRFRRVEKT